MRITFFLRNLQTGGAERQLLQTAEALATRGHAVSLVTRTPGGELPAPRDVERRVLFRATTGRLGRALELARTPARLRQAVLELRPDVVYTALLVNDALAHRALAAVDVPLVWGFRNAEQPLSRLRRLALGYLRRHASEASLAIFNCRSGEAYLRAQGFRLRATRVVPNGIDVETFRPSPAEGEALRAELGLPRDALVVGLVGRLHPMKDHPSFLDAAQRFARSEPRARFLCVGTGSAEHAALLRRHAERLGIAERVTWAGLRPDVRAVYNACDLVASTSLAEGFPNAVAEALACGRPVVATDVGDTAWAAGTEGVLVPARDAAAQARTWAEVLALSPTEREACGRAARARIAREFSVERCIDATEDALATVVRTHGTTEREAARSADRA